MALAKSFSLNSGASGDYTRLVTFRWDRSTREAVALFALYVNASAAQSGKEPLSPFVAKLRLTGDKFTQYLGNSALAQADVLRELVAGQPKFRHERRERLLAGLRGRGVEVEREERDGLPRRAIPAEGDEPRVVSGRAGVERERFRESHCGQV